MGFFNWLFGEAKDKPCPRVRSTQIEPIQVAVNLLKSQAASGKISSYDADRLIGHHLLPLSSLTDEVNRIQSLDQLEEFKLRTKHVQDRIASNIIREVNHIGRVVEIPQRIMELGSTQ